MDSFQLTSAFFAHLALHYTDDALHCSCDDISGALPQPVVLDDAAPPPPQNNQKLNARYYQVI